MGAGKLHQTWVFCNPPARSARLTRHLFRIFTLLMTTPVRRWVSAIGLTGLLIWACWPTLLDIAHGWATKPEYSHGYFVPLFSLFLLWHRRELLQGQPLEPTWWGLPLVLAGVGLHQAGARWYFDWFSAAAILPLFAGLFLTLGGWRAFRWSWPAVVFLIFMIPLPYRIEVALAYPLQNLATVASTYVLQTLGFAAVAEGNIIIMEEARIGVIEACNGLGMLVTFFAATTAVIMMIRRHWVEKVIIFLSTIPIALASNILRITATGIVADIWGSQVAEDIAHDWFGYLMMILALVLLALVLKIMSALVVEKYDGQEKSFDMNEMGIIKPFPSSKKVKAMDTQHITPV